MKNINKSKFHKEFTPEKRKLEANRIIAKYPSRVPAIVQILETSNLPDLIKKKYLLPNDLSIGQFIYIIRKQIKIESEKAIFLFVNNIIPLSSSLLSQIYKENKDTDGFLYFYISGENVFGK